jgi:hypothetical protein
MGISFNWYFPDSRLINKNIKHASMKVTTPPRLSAKKEKKAPPNDAINQYSLVKIVLNVSSFERDTITSTFFANPYL